jgi:biopolymer transport protein ExbD
MKLRSRLKPLVDVPTVASGDIAFNLIVFFLICASAGTTTGRRQDLPKAEAKKDTKQRSENVELALARGQVRVDGQPVKMEQLAATLKKKLTGRKRPEDRVVVVKSVGDVPYQWWIEATVAVEQAGGVVTLQIEETRSGTAAGGGKP